MIFLVKSQCQKCGHHLGLKAFFQIDPRIEIELILDRLKMKISKNIFLNCCFVFHNYSDFLYEKRQEVQRLRMARRTF